MAVNPSYQITPPQPMDCRNPEEWPKWFRRFEWFRQASGFSTKPKNDQVNTLLYSMSEEADDILTSLSLTDEEIQAYGTVKGKLDSYFIGSRNVIYESVKFNQRKQESRKLSILSSCHFICWQNAVVMGR